MEEGTTRPARENPGTHSTKRDAQPHKQQADKWLQVSNAFIELNEMIQKRTVFTVSMINKYQRLADLFFSNWIDLTGQEGCKNYIHSIGCGHMQEFLHWYGNLYKMSQQGWEHHNKRMNGIYHTHSQKGGRGPTEEERSRSTDSA